MSMNDPQNDRLGAEGNDPLLEGRQPGQDQGQDQESGVEEGVEEADVPIGPDDAAIMAADSAEDV